MRGLINWAALLYFLWLVVDATGILTILIDFLLVGAIPGTSVTIPASTMLAIIGGIGTILLLDLASRRIAVVHRVRRHLFTLSDRRSRLPQRRFSRI